MTADKSKLISSVMGKLKGSSGPAPESPVESDSSVGKEACVKKLFSAFESKDTKAGVAALEDFFSMSDSPEEESEIEEY